MSYIVYEKESTKRIDRLKGGPEKEFFATYTGAMTARQRFLEAQLVYGEDDILVAPSDEFYSKIEKDITGVSAQDGKTSVTVKANTPYCCDPRFEKYWSM